MIDIINFFLKVWDKSYVAIFVIIAILILRFFIKKIDKRITCILWAIPFLRLGLPITLKSYFSIMPKTNNYNYFDIINADGLYVAPFKSQSFFSSIYMMDTTPKSIISTSFDPMQVILFNIAIIWMLGIIILLVYSLVSFYKLKNTLATATILEDNVFQSDRITFPFIMGIIRPKIYLPIDLSENEKEIILMHEKAHIKRADHIFKPLTYLITIVHWFNPLAWIAYILYTKDMENACDEQVLTNSKVDIKKSYSNTLLSLAMDKKLRLKSPLAFSEDNIKLRIRNILSFKKKSTLIIIVCLVILLIASIILISDPTGMSLSERFINSLNTNPYGYADEIKTSEDLLNSIIETNTESRIGITTFGDGMSFINGNQLKNIINKHTSDITINDETKDIDGVPDCLVYMDYLGCHIDFYARENVMIVHYNGKYQVYNVTQKLYDDILAQGFYSSYYLPIELCQVVYGGKMTNKQSTNDIPNVKDYIYFDFVDIVCYLYEENGIYYCESPYLFVKEISKEYYKLAEESLSIN